MRAHRLAAVALTAAVAASVALPMTAYADAGTTSTSTPTATSTPPCAALPSSVDGRPAGLHVRGAAGDYLWHDAAGWHLRVTHRTAGRMVFAGVIVASGPMTFQPVRDEARDKVVSTADATKLAFRFVNHGGIDGVDFADSCATTLKLALVVDGHHLRRDRIYLGAQSTHPAHNPFVISRSTAQPAA